MKLEIVRSYDKDHPLFVFDAYKHKFVFMTLENPKVEKGVTVLFVLFRYKIMFNFLKEYDLTQGLM